MEAMAYTWFNRFVALRYMELHGYLDHGYRVLSHPEGKATPEIVEQAEHVTLSGLDNQKVIELKLDGTKESELYRLLLVAQCNALHEAMPFLFERIDDETELLLPDNLLHSDSLIRKLVNEIQEGDWKEVEIIGWIYQFYISEKKDQVIGKVVKSEDIPAATQLFTPNWIVKYLVQNTLGRQWLATYPDSSLRQQMEYYIEPAEQTEEVKAQLKAITPESLDPEKLTLLDPACGSGHILVEAYDLFKAIYQERGYRSRDIPRLILEKNLFGLEIDDRAAQLAAFALLMKARADDRTIFADFIQPNVLAIQESKGLEKLLRPDAADVTPTGEPLVADQDLFPDTKKQLTLTKQPQENPVVAVEPCLRELIKLFEHGKTFGSLIRVPPTLAAQLPAARLSIEAMMRKGQLWEHRVATMLMPLVKQAELLARAYDAVVTNPPYMGSKFFTPRLKDFVETEFDGFEKDLFAAFIIRSREMAVNSGHLGFMSPFTWMFISSYEMLRRSLIDSSTFTTLVQLEYSGFAEATVPICTFTFAKGKVARYAASFVRLSDFRGPEMQEPKTKEAIANPSCGWFFVATPQSFEEIPGSPMAYWVSQQVVNAFRTGKPLASLAEPRKGMVTRDNVTFIRAWHEVSFQRIGFSIHSRQESVSSKRRWFPYQKGGECRNWYGNHDWVVDWENDGYRLLHMGELGYGGGSTNHNLNYIFKRCLVWSKITSSRPSYRLAPEGFLFDDASGLCPITDPDLELPILGFLCSVVCYYLSKLINPTLNIQPGNMAVLPFIHPHADVARVVSEALAISKTEWDAFESSWDFQSSPLLANSNRSTVESSWCALKSVAATRINRLRELESENNRLFLDAYGLQSELPSDTPETQIPFKRADRERDMQRLISYAIGCMMGRYSLDKPGLFYAHSRNEGFDMSQYRTFNADADGIIPLTEVGWFPNDAAERVVEFIAKAWPSEHLEANLKFIAESIGTNKGEQPRETVRRYLAQSFFKDHLQTHKRRPIYWLFCSGKQKAFQCLVYLHRYHEGTLARMRTEYVIPLQGKMTARIEQLASDILKAASTSHRRKLEKEQDTLRKQQVELQAFDEKLRHCADQRIKLDLDDGVKVNYGKFGDLLAEITAVCGKTEDQE